MFNVTLIRPALISSPTSFSEPLTPPIGLAYLAGTLVAEGIRVTAIDAIGEAPQNCVLERILDQDYRRTGLAIEDVLERIPPDTSLIGISCMFTQDWPYAHRVIVAIRKQFPHTPIVAGGEHITALPEFSLRECPAIDYCCLGEGEETLYALTTCLQSEASLGEVSGLAYIEEGQYVETSPRMRIRNVDEIAAPAWNLLPIEKYLNNRNSHGVFCGRSMPILATRGCPYECTFCSNPVMYGRSWFPRNPGQVLDEIEGYINKYNVENIDFYDLTMVVKKRWILEFCELIKERDLHFSWQLPSGTRSEVIDDNVASALYQTGCRNLTYAPESGSQKTLRLIKKKVKLPRLISSLRSALSHGINVKCNLIIGFPHETRRDIVKTILFAWKSAFWGVHDIPFYLFSPYPGSDLFEDIRDRIYPDGLDAKYFRSLLAYMDLKEQSRYCLLIGPRELNVWRLFGMITFYGISMLLRPLRLARLLRNVWCNESDTVLEQRLGALYHRQINTYS